MSENAAGMPDKGDDLAATVEKLNAEVEKWKGLSRKHEDRAKENAEKAKQTEELQSRLSEIEASSLSESEKLQKKLEELSASVEQERAARKAAEVDAIRGRVGAERGLPPEAFQFLQGEDEESISASAEALISISKPTAVDIGQGNRGAGTTTTGDPLEATLRSKLNV